VKRLERIWWAFYGLDYTNPFKLPWWFHATWLGLIVAAAAIASVLS
jgi:hypothetical protein